MIALLLFCVIASVVMIPVLIGVLIMLGVTTTATQIGGSTGFRRRRAILRARKAAARRRRLR